MAEAEATFDVMVEIYRHLDYALGRLPLGSIEDRVQFLLSQIGSGLGPKKRAFDGVNLSLIE